ncbi:conserved hypothetical protein [Vibrio harveyi 1DA3]|nr:conserved hypothetical protein [Vibrio harveyi 1DA3]
MDIRTVDHESCLDLIPIFTELEQYYFKEQAATEKELAHYLKYKVFSEYSGVKVIAAYNNDTIMGFATYTVMFPAPKLSGQMYLKDLFVSSSARGKGVGLKLMKYLASLTVNHGCHRLDWTAESTNPIAGRFYQSIGTERVTEKEYYRFFGDTLLKFSQAK